MEFGIFNLMGAREADKLYRGGGRSGDPSSGTGREGAEVPRREVPSREAFVLRMRRQMEDHRAPGGDAATRSTATAAAATKNGSEP